MAGRPARIRACRSSPLRLVQCFLSASALRCQCPGLIVSGRPWVHAPGRRPSRARALFTFRPARSSPQTPLPDNKGQPGPQGPFRHRVTSQNGRRATRSRTNHPSNAGQRSRIGTIQAVWARRSGPGDLGDDLERAAGIEPASLAWKARVIAIIRRPRSDLCT